MPRIILECDDLDAAAIHEAITGYQRRHNAAWGETIVPEGTSSTAAAIVAEICRGWEEHQERIK